MTTGLACVIAASTALAGCAVGPRDVGSDVFELANMRESNIVPKSSPATLVKTFNSFCVDRIGQANTIATALVAADYVAVPKNAQAAIRTYVVDDTRPMVMVADNSRAVTCAVAAESRTGQTTRVARFLAETYPQAVALDPAKIGRQTETAWIINDNPLTVIFTARYGPPSAPARYVVAIHQTRSRNIADPS